MKTTQKKEALKDASHLYEVERRAYHLKRPGFRISELQLSPTQTVPWHSHNHISDTFYVLEGRLRLYLQNPKQEVQLGVLHGSSWSPAFGYECWRHLDDYFGPAGSWRIRLRSARVGSASSHSAIAVGRMMCSGKLDFSANPLNVVLTGPHASSGWPLARWGTGALPSAR